MIEPSAALPEPGRRGGPTAPTRSAAAPADRIATLLDRRSEANRTFFSSEAERTAGLCHRMAERFARGGRLIALGCSPAPVSDVRHVAVEFVHPVIVGKRALPALGLTGEGGPLTLQAELVLEADDIAIAFGLDAEEGGEGLAETRRALTLARERGCLTIAYGGSGAEWSFPIPSGDPFVRQEVAETHYHMLWELVHVFFEHRGLLEGRRDRRRHDPGESRFLYPFLDEGESDLDAVLDDVRRSVLMKAEEVGELRRRTLLDGAEDLRAAAREMGRRLHRGGTVMGLGNGGSATDAMDAVADLRTPPREWPSRRALDLTADTAIVTAVGNDIGADAIFSRQIIAYGRSGDVVLAFSTSGGSRNVIEALQEARRRELFTVALVGYDGGRIATEGLADRVVVSRSQHIPRIQEAQASAWHVLRELLEAEAR